MDLFSPTAVQAVLPDPLPSDPMPLLKQWFDDARVGGQAPNAEAMALATVGPGGEPDARIVLCKEMECDTGSLVFFTNFDSRKARHLSANPRAAVTFYWEACGRQARAACIVARITDAESDAYFATRPVVSQLGAWASRQSETIATREALIAQIASVMDGFEIQIDAAIAGRCDKPIPRPDNWGGYRLWIRRLELWSGGPGRLHERAVWERALAGGACDGLQRSAQHKRFCPGGWQSRRLQP